MKFLLCMILLSDVSSFSPTFIQYDSYCTDNICVDYTESSISVNQTAKPMNNDLDSYEATKRIPIHIDDEYKKIELIKYLPIKNEKTRKYFKYLNVSPYILGNNSVVYDATSSNVRKNVYSGDNKTNINYLSNYLPVSNVGCLNYRKSNVNCQASSFLIGNGLVLTSAHCIYNIKNKIYSNNININFSRTDNGNFSISAKVKEAYIPSTFVDDENENDDWAILKLDKDLTDKISTMTIAANISLENETYTTIGYAGDNTNNNSIYESSGYSILGSTDQYYKNYSYASSGMSGGPLVGYFSEPDERDPNVENTYEFIVGIHSGHVNLNSTYYSIATKITNSIIYACQVIGED